MLLGKRKNNQVVSYLEPLSKRFKYSILDYFFELEKTFKKIKLEHNKDCKLDFVIKNNTIISVLSIDEETINPYIYDFF
jgi:hypothetical protein